MKQLYKKIFIAAFFLLLAGWGNAAFAASQNPDFALTVSPQYPAPGQSFTVAASSFVFDPTRAKIAWYLNGKVLAAGVGLTMQTFTAGELGSSMNIRVLAESINGRVFQSELGISLGSLDFIVHPLTYIPIGYRGAAISTPASRVEIYAIPHLFLRGIRLNPADLIYEWLVNGNKILDQSGGGNNKLVLKLADIRDTQYTISLRAASINGGAATQKTIILEPQKPEIVFYETNPLTGRSPQATSDFVTHAGTQASIIAEPYFFDLESLAKAVFRWSANGSPIEAKGGDPRELNLRTIAGTESQSAFMLKVVDEKSIFQRAEASLSIRATLQ